MQPQHLGLFEGIGGFTIAAQWAGYHTPEMVEWNPYCQAVLKKNFPHAHIHGDIHQYTGHHLRGHIHVLTGGFPCQPYSHAGKRAGNNDHRALWPQMLRVIREVAPAWVIGENVAGILTMDGGRVLAGILTDLENAGYQIEIYSIPALAVGAPHERERIWIIAHHDRQRQQQPQGTIEKEWRRTTDENNVHPPHPHLQRCQQQHPPGEPGSPGFSPRCLNAGTSAHTTGIGEREPNNQAPTIGSQWHTWEDFGGGNWGTHWLPVATRLCRVDDGLPARLDGTTPLPTPPQPKKASGRAHRLEALGNSIVPHIAYQIFQAINQYESPLPNPQ